MTESVSVINMRYQKMVIIILSHAKMVLCRDGHRERKKNPEVKI